MGTEVAVVKQLDFTGEDGGPMEMIPVQKASEALKTELENVRENPSHESFQQAYAKIVEITEERFEQIRKCAANAAASGTGEGALRSMRDQFRSLKGSYVSLDTKEAFIDALMAGRPDGTESSLLTQAQSATSQSAEELRKSKKRKEEVADEIRGTLEVLCEEYKDFARLKAELGAVLEKLNASMTAYDEAFETYTKYSNNAKLPKEKLRQSIAEAKSAEAEKEQRKARQESDVQEMEAEVEALEERMNAVRSKLREYESAETKSDIEDLEERRLQEHKEWLQSTIEVIGKVSGLRILDVSDSELHISVRTEPDAAAFAAAKFEGCEYLEGELETVEHEVCVGISSADQVISAMRMTPNDVPCQDLLENFKGTDYIPAFVHAINARIASFKVREAYIKSLDADALNVEVRWPVSVSDKQDVGFKKVYNGETAIELVMPCDWPQSAAKLTLETNNKALDAMVQEFNASSVAEGSITAAVHHLDGKLNM
ncbi:hypothetical protein HOP50_02g13060 [Chloropicon primus]|uniref:Kinetochore protein Sos7 coiled-coil domain-containing protein n=1 Tax=Chloropicon primus TaxID=1764295 RepID=A0A5B8MHG2_9CHLO|nr:hypothetical protein A3770_02p13200 [Chloropicon primus]UPQ98009.1 hypothetical protein HOP50_02g13060 [Chloropicon primus]|eukprot:QDZ18802.1 hypothetical protein A3770_02p13200 [Chloropicon primus]